MRMMLIRASDLRKSIYAYLGNVYQGDLLEAEFNDLRQKSRSAKSLDRFHHANRRQVEQMIGILGDADTAEEIRLGLRAFSREVQLLLFMRLIHVHKELARVPSNLRIPIPKDPDEWLQLVAVTWWNDLVGWQNDQ